MAKTFIRLAEGSDFPVLLHIDESCFPPGVAYDSAELSYYMSRPGAETLVLEDAGRIAAFLVMEVHHKRKTATIVTLDVIEAFRRCGYGTRLMRHAEDLLYAHGVERYSLQVDVTNAGAVEFYKKHGFQTTRVLKAYYANGHDAYEMFKTLQKGAGA